jgi:hypothetical protein
MEVLAAPRRETPIVATLLLVQLIALLASGLIGERALKLVGAATAVVVVLLPFLLPMAETIAQTYIKL